MPNTTPHLVSGQSALANSECHPIPRTNKELKDLERYLYHEALITLISPLEAIQFKRSLHIANLIIFLNLIQILERKMSWQYVHNSQVHNSQILIALPVTYLSAP